MMAKKSEKKNRMGHFERENIINIVLSIGIVLLSLIAAFVGPLLFGK
jgi:hypothetical protein